MIGDCRCRRAIVSRLYTNNNNNNSNDHGSSSPSTSPDASNDQSTLDTELVDNNPFWVPPSTKTIAKRPPTSINFVTLLDDMIKDRRLEDSRYITKGLSSKGKAPPIVGEPRRRRTTLIEQRLLEMVQKQRTIYKEKAPLPRTMMGAVYGKTAQAYGDTKNTSSKSRALDTKQLDAIYENKGIQAHDREIKTIDDLLSTKTRHDLLAFFNDCISGYQERQEFPSYYSTLVKNAIHHAFTNFRDPYLAVTLFEQCKTMSIQSYIEGCTVDVYNQVLGLRWTAWEDIYGMLDLMEEMTLNGIAFDKQSVGIVKTITDEMERQELAAGSDQVLRWSPDDLRSTELMKMLVGKWIFK
jgi:hypothetical protein